MLNFMTLILRKIEKALGLIGFNLEDSEAIEQGKELFKNMKTKLNLFKKNLYQHI